MRTTTAGEATDIGRVRAQNQDGTLVDDLVFGVADGLGGGGEVASILALATLRASFGANPTPEGLSVACHEANTAVWARAQADAELATMGTTLTAAARLGDGSAMAVVSIGDSRCYRYRDGELRRITRDHSLVQDMIDAGELSEAEALEHPQRPILTRVLGMGPAIEPDLFTVDVVAGDRLLLCTDGLVTEVDESAMADVLRSVPEPARAASSLVQQATQNGGHDNSSAVVVDVSAPVPTS
jgi:protein phosphatase